MTYNDIIGFIGVFITLLAYFLIIFDFIPKEGVLFYVMNIVGAGLACYASVLIVLMVLAAMFAYSNPQPIDVDIGFMRFEQVSMAIAFAVALALGWLLGVLSAGLTLWRSAGEKRRLEQDLKFAEAELRARPPSS